MTAEQKQSFHLTSFVFDLDGDELDFLLQQAGLNCDTAEPQQVKDLVREHLGDEKFYACLAYGDARFDYGGNHE